MSDALLKGTFVYCLRTSADFQFLWHTAIPSLSGSNTRLKSPPIVRVVIRVKWSLKFVPISSWPRLFTSFWPAFSCLTCSNLATMFWVCVPRVTSHSGGGPDGRWCLSTPLFQGPFITPWVHAHTAYICCQQKHKTHWQFLICLDLRYLQIYSGTHQSTEFFAICSPLHTSSSVHPKLLLLLPFPQDGCCSLVVGCLFSYPLRFIQKSTNYIVITSTLMCNFGKNSYLTGLIAEEQCSSELCCSQTDSCTVKQNICHLLPCWALFESCLCYICVVKDILPHCLRFHRICLVSGCDVVSWCHGDDAVQCDGQQLLASGGRHLSAQPPGHHSIQREEVLLHLLGDRLG